MTRSDRQRVLREIEDAFADVPRPPDERLVTHPDAISGDDAEITAAFRGKRWQDLPLELLIPHHEAPAEPPVRRDQHACRPPRA